MPCASLQLSLVDHTAVIGVIGLGYVGLPLLLAFAEQGFRVVGIDIDAHKIAALARGHSYMHHIAATRIARAQNSQRLTATCDFSALRDCAAILLCVPTPLNGNREPDLSYIESTAQSMAPYIQRGQLIVLESTTYPGTTRGILCHHLECGSRLQAGKAFHLAFSPEREDPGNGSFAFADIPKVVGGLTAGCLEAAVALYRAVVKQVVPVSTLEAAELSKLLENIFRSVNIALVNELKTLSLAMGIDIWEVIDAAATKPFGYMPFYPGPGLGGHCIPIDPFYLAWKAREFKQPTRFIELAGEINARMPLLVVERIAWALKAHCQTLRGSLLLILGVAYKKNVDDLRESPALHIIHLLQDQGAQVAYHDAFVPHLSHTRTHHFDMTSIVLTDQVLAGCDAAVILTDHAGVDYARVVALAPMTIDTRNATRDVTQYRQRIVAA